MLETILNNFHLEKILWILQKRIAYIMILGVLGGMAGGAYAYLTNSTLYRAEVSFYVYSDSGLCVLILRSISQIPNLPRPRIWYRVTY